MTFQPSSTMNPCLAHEGDRVLKCCSRSLKPMKPSTTQLILPDPVEAIKFRMDQAGLTPKDLVPFIGRLNRVRDS